MRKCYWLILNIIYILFIHQQEGSEVKKVIDFKVMGLVRSIQDYANERHDGNFTAAVIELCQDALALYRSKKQ